MYFVWCFRPGGLSWGCGGVCCMLLVSFLVSVSVWWGVVAYFDPSVVRGTPYPVLGGETPYGVSGGIFPPGGGKRSRVTIGMVW